MKRKILSALAAITALALASCSMFNSGSEEDSSQPAYIKVGVKDISRSALPNVTKEDEFENFTLTGTAEGENVLAVKENVSQALQSFPTKPAAEETGKSE